MKAVINPDYYHSSKILKAENERIFGASWSFVGFKRELSKPNDFITSTIAGIPILVQNVGGKIKAFRNVCSHRFSIIQTESRGNRILMCPYHGWTYNAEGLPVGIPKKPLFEFNPKDLECLKLQEFELGFCGDLVFVSLNPNGSGIQTYLGGMFPVLEKLSQSWELCIDINEIYIEANWKVVVENTLESYHVNLIHSDSFRKLGTTGLNFEFYNEHSLWYADVKYPEDDPRFKVLHKPYINRPYRIPGYVHMLVFPNVLISSTYGISFNLSHIIPMGSGKSKFVSYVLMTKKDDKLESSAIEKEYEKSLIDFNRKVFEEDRVICEEVQKGVAHTIYQGELSEEEARVCEFQKAYISRMKS